MIASLSSSYIEDDIKCFGFVQCNFHIIILGIYIQCKCLVQHEWRAIHMQVL